MIVQCGRHIKTEELDQIRETVKTFQWLSQTEIAQTVCEHLGWHTASGANKVVKDKEETALFNEYLNRYHYLGYKQPFGCHLRYFMESAETILGCMLFSGAARAFVVGSESFVRSTKKQMRALAVGRRATNSRRPGTPPAEVPDEQYPLVLSTGRRLYHYHTRTQTGRCEGLNDLLGEETAHISFADANLMGIENGEKIRVRSRRGEYKACAVRIEKL